MLFLSSYNNCMVKSPLVVLYRMGVVCVLLESIFYCTLSELAISIIRYGLMSFITINFICIYSPDNQNKN